MNIIKFNLLNSAAPFLLNRKSVFFIFLFQLCCQTVAIYWKRWPSCKSVSVLVCSIFFFTVCVLFSQQHTNTMLFLSQLSNIDRQHVLDGSTGESVPWRSRSQLNFFMQVLWMAISGSFYMLEMVTKATRYINLALKGIPALIRAVLKRAAKSPVLLGKRSKQLPDIAFKSFARKDLRP